MLTRQVVLAASICTRGGKTIVTRQFRDMPKDRVPALLAGFPKLMNSGTQHTTVENDEVRYVYQSIEELYLVLITNRQSNILQDIETLRLLGQIVSVIVRQADEREILSNCFEIMSAFDEVISLGYRENLTVAQVKTYLEMESSEEKLHDIIERNKELEAAEERKLRAKQLELSRREMAKRPTNGSFQGGMGNVPNPNMGLSSFGSASTPRAPVTTYDLEETSKPRMNSLRGKGLQLGKKKTGALHNLRGSLGGDAESALLLEARQPTKNNSQTQSLPSSHTLSNGREVENDGIHIAIKEEVSATVERMGTVKSAEIKGSLQLRIADPDLTNIHILVQADGPSSQYRTHPNVDKAAFLKEKVIRLKDSRRQFPANNQQLSVLRWQLSGKSAEEATLVPLEFHCWFVASEDGSGHLSGIVEYEMVEGYTETLSDVKIKIPLMTGDVSVSSNEQTFNQYDDGLEWVIPEIVPGTDTASGSFEWVAEALSEDDFFPMMVEFEVDKPLTTFGRVQVLDVVSATDESSVAFKSDIYISAESFSIV